MLLCARGDVEAPVGAWRERGLTVAGVVADVSTSEGRASLVEATRQHFSGAVDVFFSNAGMNIRKPTEEYTDEVRSCSTTEKHESRAPRLTLLA